MPHSPYVDQLIPELQDIIQKLQALNWFQRTFRRRPEALIKKYYELDGIASQLMDHKCMSPEQLQILLPIWQAGYNGLYKRFPEKK